MSWLLMLTAFVGGLLVDRIFFSKRYMLRLSDVGFRQAVIHSCNGLSLVFILQLVDSAATSGFWTWAVAVWLTLVVVCGAAYTLLEKQERMFIKLEALKVSGHADDKSPSALSHS